VSDLNEWILNTSTPGVTFSSITRPSTAVFPETNNWGDSISSSDERTAYIYALQKKNPTQPGGIIAPWGVSFNNANDSPISIQWQSFNDGNEISTGNVIAEGTGADFISCDFIKPTADKASVSVSNGCEYKLIVINTHTPTSKIQGVALQIPSANGSILNINGMPTEWTAGPITSNGVLIQTNNNDLAIGASDTFFFTITPTTPGSSWPLTLFTFQAVTDGQLTDTVINVPGCIPAVVCDSVTAYVDTTACLMTLTVLNRRNGLNIDSVVVKPMGGWHIGTYTKSIPPWSLLPLDANADSAIFVGQTAPEASQSFPVEFNFGPNTNPFPVEVNSYANGVVCSSTVTMTCATSDVTLVPAPGTDLALTVAPNPLNNRSDIGFTLGSFSNVDLMLVDILGRTQATLFSGALSSGDHTLPLDASALAPGTYYIRLEAEGQRMTKKIVVEH
jgi:hypothetical protein